MKTTRVVFLIFFVNVQLKHKMENIKNSSVNKRLMKVTELAETMDNPPLEESQVLQIDYSVTPIDDLSFEIDL